MQAPYTAAVEPPRNKRPTSYDVAVHAGVSQATVSRVLTGNVKVSGEVRDRVLRALAELDYEPNSAARAMKTGHTGQIGVVMSAITNPFHQEMLREVSQRLVAANLNPLVWYLDHGADEQAVQAIRRGGVDGILLTSATSSSATLEAAIDKRLPAVLLHRTVDDSFCDQVGGDNWRGGYEVAQYFVDNGHTRIGMVTGSLMLSTTRERERGFRAGLLARGLDIAEQSMVRGDVSHATGVAATERFLGLVDPPTAVFTTSDLLAFGVIDALGVAGRSTPEDMWVVGFDNTDMADWYSFQLTSVDQPTREMVGIAVDLLREQIDGVKRPPKKVVLPCELVIRRSTANVAYTPRTPIPDEPGDNA
jgi:LacI family transcriptional regulator